MQHKIQDIRGRQKCCNSNVNSFSSRALYCRKHAIIQQLMHCTPRLNSKYTTKYIRPQKNFLLPMSTQNTTHHILNQCPSKSRCSTAHIPLFWDYLCRAWNNNLLAGQRSRVPVALIITSTKVLLVHNVEDLR